MLIATAGADRIDVSGAICETVLEVPETEGAADFTGVVPAVCTEREEVYLAAVATAFLLPLRPFFAAGETATSGEPIRVFAAASAFDFALVLPLPFRLHAVFFVETDFLPALFSLRALPELVEVCDTTEVADCVAWTLAGAV